jgi:hypothetical protein
VPAALAASLPAPGDLRAQLDDARAAHHAEVQALRAELAAARAAVEAITGSRTWRYSQPVRATLALVRERRR